MEVSDDKNKYKNVGRLPLVNLAIQLIVTNVCLLFTEMKESVENIQNVHHCLVMGPVHSHIHNHSDKDIFNQNTSLTLCQMSLILP